MKPPYESCKQVASYKVQILPDVVRKDLANLPKKDVLKIMERIKLLENNPRPAWSKKLSGRGEYRGRQGSYRILYLIKDTIKIVQVTKVGHRRDVYQ
jgi:mRNA interferase RelE/StbE